MERVFLCTNDMQHIRRALSKRHTSKQQAHKRVYTNEPLPRQHILCSGTSTPPPTTFLLSKKIQSLLFMLPPFDSSVGGIQLLWKGARNQHKCQQTTTKVETSQSPTIHLRGNGRAPCTDGGAPRQLASGCLHLQHGTDELFGWEDALQAYQRHGSDWILLNQLGCNPMPWAMLSGTSCLQINICRMMHCWRAVCLSTSGYLMLDSAQPSHMSRERQMCFVVLHFCSNRDPFQMDGTMNSETTSPSFTHKSWIQHATCYWATNAPLYTMRLLELL